MDINEQIKAKLNDINIYKNQKEQDTQQKFKKLIELYEEVLNLSYESDNVTDIKKVIASFVGFVGEKKHRYDVFPHIEKTLAIAQQRQILDLELECLCLKGQLYFQFGKKTKAIKLLQVAQRKNKNHEDIKIEIRINICFAIIFRNIGWYDKSLFFLNKIEKLLRKNGEDLTREHSTYYNTLGGVHRESKNYKKALNYYKKALNYYTILKCNKHISMVYNNLGILYQRQGKYKKALYHLNLALGIKKNMELSFARTLSVIGDVYAAQGKLNQAEKQYKESLILSKNKGHIKNIISTKIALGNLYGKQNKYKKSEKILKKSKKAALKTDFDSLLEQSYAALEILYENIENHEIALQYSKKSRTLYQKIQNKQYKAQLVVNDTFNKISEKELEIEKQKEKTYEVKHRVKNHFGVLNGLVRQLKRQKIEQTGILKVEACIHAMSALHEMLYNVNEVAPITNVSKFLKRLTAKVQEVHQNLDENSQKIKLKYKSDKNIFLKSDSCLDLGLIVAEIMTNTYKYAFGDFKEIKTPLIAIKLKKNKKKKVLVLVIMDNGYGLKYEAVEKRGDSFGTIFIKNYVRKLGGTIEWPKRNEKGTRYKIILPL